MTESQTIMTVIATLALLAMAIVQLRRALALDKTSRGHIPRSSDGSFPHTCEVCGDQTIVTRESIHALSSAEKALVVRECAAGMGKNMAEYVCRSCDASHCFALHANEVLFLGVNLYEGQKYGARCVECLVKLNRPTWDPGQFDGDIASAPGNVDSLGLVCSHCRAVCCVACCKGVTRNRTSDGSYLCPRCFRGPQATFFHP